MKSRLALAALASICAMPAWAASCGTVSAPAACSIAIGKVLYTFSDFNFVWGGSSGPTYSGADIDIDVGTLDQHAASLTFSKNGHSAGTAFSAAPPNGMAYFTVEYKATISPVGAGAVAYDAPVAVKIIDGSATGAGDAGVDLSMTSLAQPLTCRALIESSGPVSQPPCTFPAQTIPLSNGIFLDSNTGAANLSSFSNTVSAKFVEPRNLDIDGDGNPDPLTDGLLVLRYLFGLRGDALISNAVATDAPRKTAPQIEQYLDLLLH